MSGLAISFLAVCLLSVRSSPIWVESTTVLPDGLFKDEMTKSLTFTLDYICLTVINSSPFSEHLLKSSEISVINLLPCLKNSLIFFLFYR